MEFKGNVVAKQDLKNNGPWRRDGNNGSGDGGNASRRDGGGTDASMTTLGT